MRSGRYAPAGPRSWGPVMAGMRHDGQHRLGRRVIALIPMIETVEAISNLDDILSVPGVDAIYVGPADLSITLGLKPGNNDGEGDLRRRAGDHRRRLCRHGVVPGIHATGVLIACAASRASG